MMEHEEEADELEPTEGVESDAELPATPTEDPEIDQGGHIHLIA